MRSFSGLYTGFCPNTEKYGPEKAPYLDMFHAVDSLIVLIKCSRYRVEDTKIVTFDVIRLYGSICHEFGIKALDYFLTMYQEDLRPRFK